MQGKVRPTKGESAGPQGEDRPRVTLNAAVSLDGRIAGAGGRRLLLSDEEDARRVHRLRAASDAILVGVGTVLADDPALTVRREWVPGARDPLRVVLDSRGRVPAGARVLDSAAPTRVYQAVHPPVDPAPDGTDGPTRIVVAAGARGVDLGAVLADLGQAGVRSVMVEGGARVIGSFLTAGLVDELFLFVAPVVVGAQSPALVSAPAPGVGPLASFRLLECDRRESGVLLRLVPGTRS